MCTKDKKITAKISMGKFAKECVSTALFLAKLWKMMQHIIGKANGIPELSSLALLILCSAECRLCLDYECPIKPCRISFFYCFVFPLGVRF